MASLLLREIKKKSVHLIILLALLFYNVIKDKHGGKIALLAFVAILIIFLILEYFRLELNYRIPVFPFIKAKEQERIHGVIYFLSATIICLAVFDFRIALAALLMTTFGEVASSIMGKKYGTTLFFRDKTSVGCLSGLITNLIIGIIILTNAHQFYIIIAMAFTATIIETLVDELDDNLLVPLFAGFVGQMLITII